MRSEDGFKGEEPHAEAVYWAGIDDILSKSDRTFAQAAAQAWKERSQNLRRLLGGHTSTK